MWASPETFKNICISYNPSVISDLFNSIVEAKLIYSDYIKPSPRDRGCFLTDKGKSVLSSKI